MRTITGFIACLLATTAAAGPDQFTHSGRLTDALGTPIDGSNTLTIAIHTDESTVTNDYVAVFTDEPIEDGYYSVILGGPGTPSFVPTLFDNSELWVSVAVGAGGLELNGRTRILAVPYATHASRSDDLVGAESCPDGVSPRWNTTNGAWECGRKHCPTGMTLVDTAGPSDAFCIDPGAATSAGWMTPKNSWDHCAGRGMRMCTGIEYRMWCDAGMPGKVGDERFYIWELSGISDNNPASRIGAPHCTTQTSTWPSVYWDPSTETEVRNVRCCLN